MSVAEVQPTDKPAESGLNDDSAAFPITAWVSAEAELQTVQEDTDSVAGEAGARVSEPLVPQLAPARLERAGQPIRLIHSAEEVRQFWDENAYKWEDHRALGSDEDIDWIIRVIRDALRPHLLDLRYRPSRLQIVDLMSGANPFAYYLPDISPRNVTAVDVSPAMLARNKAEEKILADVRQPPIPQLISGRFDLATLVFGWRYLESGTHRGVLSEIHRCLKPGGGFVIIDLVDNQSRMNVCRFDVQAVRRLAEQIGFGHIATRRLVDVVDKKHMFLGITIPSRTTIDYISGRKPQIEHA
ncbi:class I SAM-dependent methyltransferase [Candidatus Gottesmanbacteria bacterium]|nr:class I SAM-dependent methyltransferase [Candidatus Gottesmanbacteria bacterium]